MRLKKKPVHAQPPFDSNRTAAPWHRLQQGVLDELCINTIRTLAIDAVQQADSAHPGTPMAWRRSPIHFGRKFLGFNPDDPIWLNRDRFVLSNGHASMLLYALLHLSGVNAVDAKCARLR